MFLLGIALGCYLLCWYCKRVEKRRQRGGAPPQLRAASVDRLLQTLILNYRRRKWALRILSTAGLNKIPGLGQDQASAPNVDQLKEAPPGYADALKMPKPRKEADQAVPSYEQAINA